MGKYIVVTVEERLAVWRELDQQACTAERALAAIGQAEAPTGVRDLIANAKSFRERADREFDAICRAIRASDSHMGALGPAAHAGDSRTGSE